MPGSPPGRATSPEPYPASPSVSIVIPVHDAAGLPLVLRGLPEHAEVVVVTAAGDAGMLAAIRAACPSAVVTHPTRDGIGNALACGIAAGSGEVVVLLDGSGSTDPAEIPHLLAALAGAEAVFGSRYLAGGRSLTGGRFRRGLDLLLTWLLAVLFGARRTDPGFGYAAFRRTSLDWLDLPDPGASGPVLGDGPEFTPLLTVRAASRALTVTEVAAVAYPRVGPSARRDRPRLRHWLRAMASELRYRSADRPAAAPVQHVGASVPASTGKPFPGTSDGTKPIPGVPGTGGPIWGPPSRRPNLAADMWLAKRPSDGPPATFGRPGTNPHGRTDRVDNRKPIPRPRLNPDAPADPRDLQGRPDSASWAAAQRWFTNRGDAARAAEFRAAEIRAAEVRAAEIRAGEIGAVEFPGDLDLTTDVPVNLPEVGAARRHLESYCQRPDLRVINGEGQGNGRSRGPRLRSVPRDNGS